jgi:hypothetical protein
MKITFKNHVRKESREEARRLKDEYEIDDQGGILHLLIFADADTTERNAQDIVNRDGLILQDRFGQKRAHPLLTVIRDARSQKLAALKALNLDIVPLRDRPGRPGGK